MGSQKDSILEKRYLRNDEKTEFDIYSRVSNFLGNNIKERKQFYDEMANHRFMPNSPCLVNAGISESTGALFACFVLGIEDSMDSIFTTLRDAALIHKGGGGTGFNFSTLRPANSPVKTTQGISSGPLSFMQAYNAATETVKQGGVRRGANMACFSIHHPDVIDFIKCKDNLTSFQNFNISVLLDDKFMDAVANDNKWYFNFDGEQVGEPVEARWLMDLIVEQAWKNGEPGIIFIDEINRKHPLPDMIESTNPCLTGDTQVFVGDGRYIISLKDLYDEYVDNPANFNVPVLAYDNVCGRNKFESINCVIYSGYRDVYRITLDDGSYVDATEEHRFLLSDGVTKVELQYLKPGDCLLPFRATIYGGNISDNTFSDIYVGMNNGKYNNYYHLQAEHYFGTDLNAFGIQKDEFCVHHKDEKHNNNRPYNIEVKRNCEHNSEHMVGDNNTMRRWFANASEEVRNRYKDNMRASTSGELNGHYGKSHSAEAKLKIGNQTKSYMKNLKVKAKHIDGNMRHRARMIKSVLSILHDNNMEYTSDNYTAHRYNVSKVCPTWDNIIKTSTYFGFTDYDLFFEYLNNDFNHSIVSIHYIGKADVYDLNVNNNHNFAIVTKGERHGGQWRGKPVKFNVISGIQVSNCGEQPLLSYEACCLGSINLSKFVNNDNSFDFDSFDKTIGIAVKCLNRMLDKNQYPLPKIKEISEKNRKIGLGVMGYADMLIKMGLRYGSPEALKTTDLIASHFQHSAHLSSQYLAEVDGPFVNFDISNQDVPIRNCTVTTIAPTGTISTICETSSGIEPIFSPMMVIRRVDSVFVELHPLFEEMLKEQCKYETFIEHFNKSQGIRKDGDPIIKEPNILDYLPELKGTLITAHEVTPENHVKTQAVWQKYTDNAVSKTINMPNEATKQDVWDAYMLAYNTKCKGLTVYRDGSRQYQVLSTTEEVIATELERGEIAPSRDDLIGRKKKLRTGCGNLHCTAWFDPDTGDLFELFLNKGSEGGCNSFMTALSRSVSSEARLGASIYHIIEQLASSIPCVSYVTRTATKHDTAPGSSCPSAVAKVLPELQESVLRQLGKLEEEAVDIIHDTEYINKCPLCNSVNVKHESGCTTCIDCGYSSCG